MNRLDDNNIRTALIKHLSQAQTNVIVEEFTVPSGKARADVVSINGHVNAYEIKSDFDSLQRLSSQIVEYDSAFEINHIVTGEKYYNKVDAYVPSHWGIILASTSPNSKIHLRFIRRGTLNPDLDFREFLSLLSSDQVKKMAIEAGIGSYLNLPKTEVRKLFKQDVLKKLDSILPNYKKNALKKEVRTALKIKYSDLLAV